jgi:hypothetical protein
MASYNDAVVKSSVPADGSSRSGMRLSSMAIGSPSNMRRRRSSNSSAPGAMPNASASSIVAGRIAEESTWAVASRPRQRPSSDMLISVFGGSTSASPVTNEPRPRASTRPSVMSSAIARRTVARLTPSSSQNQRSEGRRSPGWSAPVSISRAISR